MLSETVDPAAAFRRLTALAALGERVAGSPAERQGVEQLARELERLGLAVACSAFPIKRWMPRAVELLALEPEAFDVPAIAVCFGGSLPAGRHDLPLAFAGVGAADDLARDDLAGKALLIARDVYRDYPDTALVEQLAPLRPSALVFTASPGHRGGIPSVFYNFRDLARAAPPPCLVVAFDDALRLVQSGTRRVRARLEAEIADGSSSNVVGELPGTDRADEVIVVCAHHDSAPSSPGACDNAGGTACVMELARICRAAGPFRRTLHFAVWGAHETGMHGSEAYLRDARERGLGIVAAINFDTVGLAIGEDRLFVLGGPDWRQWVTGAIAPTGIQPVVVPGPGYTDYTNFGAAGIPSISFGQGFANWNHTPGDTVERCAPYGLHKPLRLAAAALEALARGEGDCRAGFDGELIASVRAFNGRWGWSNFTAPA